MNLEGVGPENILRYHHNIRESYHLVNEYSHSDWLTAKGGINPSSPNSDKDQFSPDNIHTLSRDKL